MYLHCIGWFAVKTPKAADAISVWSRDLVDSRNPRNRQGLRGFPLIQLPVDSSAPHTTARLRITAHEIVLNDDLITKSW